MRETFPACGILCFFQDHQGGICYEPRGIFCLLGMASLVFSGGFGKVQFFAGLMGRATFFRIHFMWPCGSYSYMRQAQAVELKLARLRDAQRIARMSPGRRRRSTTVSSGWRSEAGRVRWRRHAAGLRQSLLHRTALRSGDDGPPTPPRCFSP